MNALKSFIFLVVCLFVIPLAAQEQKEVVVKSDVSEATVFINGAQVLRKKTVSLQPGKTKIRFTNLSPYIDAKSVQVKVAGEVMVMSVNHQSNYIDSIQKPKTLTKTSSERLQEISDLLTLERINQEVINEELQFLAANKSIGGANTGISLLTLKETSTYYKDRVLALKLKLIESQKKTNLLNTEQNAIIYEGRQDGATNKRKPIGEVVVEVECKQAVRADMSLTYYVNNAGWFPTYDIRAIDVNKPIQLVYKANVRQNTGVDWNNVKLTVSSSDPNLGNVVPQMKTYYLNYNTAPPRYNIPTGNNEVTGIVMDNQNEPLIGVSVTVPGTTIGTSTDIDGRFSLPIPQNGNMLEFNYIGFKSQTLPISRSFMTVRLEENNVALDEVVVVGYGTHKKHSVVGAVASVESRELAKPAAPAFTRSDIAIPTAQVENQTAVDFEIKVPYTVKSDNKNTIIEVDRYELPAEYEYFSIPKINKEAFLLANIVDWEKYNLLAGEANIFFENTYIGKTILDTRYVSDTLNISLGRDRNILISRDKGKDTSSKKFFGNKKEDTRAWKINVRNNKSQPIELLIIDQVPVSTNSEIEVDTQNVSGGALNAETGEVKWRLKLKPSDKKELELKYKVKYPKDKTLIIE